MRPLTVIALAACAALLVTQLPAIGAKPTPAPQEVEVVNFPDPQNVTGSVEVTNLPDVQDVNVTNEPLIVMPAPSLRYQLVGFTTGELLGNSGVLGFTQACQNELQVGFPDVRLCTEEEIIRTSTIPAGLPLGARAWVTPLAVVSNPGISNCGGWISAISDGATVDSNGSFVRRSCETPRPIACCAPVP